ncbi:hypothetical protein ACXR2W_09550 [Leucobacter sp. HY1908]
MMIDFGAAAITTSLLWSSESDGEGLWLLGPAAGIGFYVFYYLRYRNTNKRHAFERATKSEVVGLTGTDKLVGNVRGVENSRIAAENLSAPRLRLGAHSRYIEE